MFGRTLGKIFGGFKERGNNDKAAALSVFSLNAPVRKYFFKEVSITPFADGIGVIKAREIVVFDANLLRRTLRNEKRRTSLIAEATAGFRRPTLLFIRDQRRTVRRPLIVVFGMVRLTSWDAWKSLMPLFSCSGSVAVVAPRQEDAMLSMRIVASGLHDNFHVLWIRDERLLYALCVRIAPEKEFDNIFFVAADNDYLAHRRVAHILEQDEHTKNNFFLACPFRCC